MKIRGIGIEIFVDINEDELNGLEKGCLKGTIRFSDVQGREQDTFVSTEIRVTPNQKEDLVIKQNPSDCYMALADNISFLVNKYFYGELKERGSNGQRFYFGGKLIIKVKY